MKENAPSKADFVEMAGEEKSSTPRYSFTTEKEVSGLV